MSRSVKGESHASQQQGQVLAEAVVVMLLLVVLLVAVSSSGRWQFQWLKQWLMAQTAADAIALGHEGLPGQVSVNRTDIIPWQKSAMREFSVGDPRWHQLTTKGRFAQSAWRLKGSGYASVDKTVTERIEQAPRLWRKSALASKPVIYALLPTIKAVEAPWEDRGSSTDWLRRWQGSTPEAYLMPRYR